jgi:serine phosphatase RsbU (regulator of sigma subunit)/anti-sigma regulatory factor (Ser/Thr protein kinase)
MVRWRWPARPSRLAVVSGPLVRRLRLPAAGSSPALARQAVGGLVAEAGLADVLDEALLLTSELVTNGVVHARTEIELEIIAGPGGLRVSVTDFAAPTPTLVITEVRAGMGTGDPSGEGHGRLVQLDQVNRDDGGPAEGGRGLLLVSRFASRWGTSHERGGRTVWFSLDAPDRPRAGLSGVDGRADEPPLETVIDTVVGAGRARLRRADTLSDLLGRLARGLGAATATVTVDRGDGHGSEVVARYATAGSGSADGRTVRVPLALTRPWTGEFTATGARSRHAAPVAALTAGQLALMIENQRLRDAHHDRRGWLLFLAEAGELLAQSMNVDLTVALIPRIVVPRLGQWCALHLANQYGELDQAALTHADEAELAPLSESLTAALPRLQRVLGGDGFAPLGVPLDAMSYPLTVRGERIGTLTVGRPAGRGHTPDEMAVAEDLARRVAVAIDNARTHATSSRIATTLQRPLLPPTLPTIDGLEVAAQYVPAGGDLAVGGDFYDVVELPQQGWMLVVGDVSGKDVGAAVVTGLVRDVLHTLALDAHDPVHTLSRLNETLVERGGGYFCTLALAYLRPVQPGVFDLALHLAGHDQPVLLRADGTTNLVGSSGTALGLMDTIVAPRASVRLHRGDSLVFYTDGVTERRRGRALFGHRRLRSEVEGMVGAPASVLASHLRSAVLSFSPQPPRDDIAIVALRAV